MKWHVTFVVLSLLGCAGETVCRRPSGPPTGEDCTQVLDPGAAAVMGAAKRGRVGLGQRLPTLRLPPDSRVQSKERPMRTPLVRRGPRRVPARHNVQFDSTTLPIITPCKRRSRPKDQSEPSDVRVSPVALSPATFASHQCPQSSDVRVSPSNGASDVRAPTKQTTDLTNVRETSGVAERLDRDQARFVPNARSRLLSASTIGTKIAKVSAQSVGYSEGAELGVQGEPLEQIRDPRLRLLFDA